MRVLMFVAVACFIVAFLGQVSAINGVDVLAWLLAGFVAWSVDVAVGGYTYVRRVR